MGYNAVVQNVLDCEVSGVYAKHLAVTGNDDGQPVRIESLVFVSGQNSWRISMFQVLKA